MRELTGGVSWKRDRQSVNGTSASAECCELLAITVHSLAQLRPEYPPLSPQERPASDRAIATPRGASGRRSDPRHQYPSNETPRHVRSSAPPPQSSVGLGYQGL